MAAMVAVCTALARKKLTNLVMIAVCLKDPGSHAVLQRRGCSQYKQITSNKDLPVPMENPYEEPLKKCILCEKCVDYKNIQVFMRRNRKNSQKRLSELKNLGLHQLHTRILHISTTLKFLQDTRQ
ncbi:PREDICTED: 28S ribosomal protein S18c, mitochondrial-like [Galeopterus variegatus]|uniref:28S ribosomal protein S18c, mitochondrial-like n=1 Tax=Galeopterus variegatus TaxID=482537 RepID=A0ABM0Q949_GALVR|nr:PREDICTED: 28S ribosomal protein S18c, mitochondrial-like [Galeopterus variegatus]